MKWSIYAHYALRRCQRQYLFSYIAASHAARDHVRHEAYLLKQLQTLAMWQGDIVHDAFHHFIFPQLRPGLRLDEARVITDTINMALDQFAYSLRSEYRTAGATKKSAGIRYAALHDHEYGMPVSEAQLQAVLGTVRTSLANLFAQGSLLDEVGASRSRRYCEGDFPFHLDEVTISPKLDLMYLNAKGLPVIIDWKVSAAVASDYSQQLMVYALAIKNWWKVIQPEDITVKEVNLLENSVSLYPVTADGLLEIEDFIYRSITQIKDLYGDGKWNDQDMESLEPAKSSKTCIYCKFRKLCQEVYRDLPSLEHVSDQEPGQTQLQLPIF